MEEIIPEYPMIFAHANTEIIVIIVSFICTNVSFNSLGVAAGKMLSPQSLAIALSSVNAKGEDAKLMARVMPYGLLFLVLMSILGFVGAQIF